MFYIDHFDEKTGNYAIADSDDGVIEYLSQQKVNELAIQGLYIRTWSEATPFITESMNKKCNYHLWKKLERGCSTSELIEYLERYSVYSIAQRLNQYNTQLDFRKSCRIMDYSQTSNYFLIVLGLTNGMTILLQVSSDYSCLCVVVEEELHFEKYPSCAGNFISRLLQKQGISCAGIIADEVYLVMYNKTNTTLVLLNQYRMCSADFIIRVNINNILV